eukprot:g17470.t1
MGANQSSNGDPTRPMRPGAPPPPPVVTNTFVLRNGRYESQALMPVNPFADASGFEGGFPGANGGSQARMWRPLHPPDLKQTKLIQSPLHLRRGALLVEEEDGILFLTIGFDAACPLKIHVSVLDGDSSGSRSALQRPFPEARHRPRRRRATDLSLCKQTSVIHGQISDLRLWKTASDPPQVRVELVNQALQYAADADEEIAHDARRAISRDQCWDMQEVYGVQNPDAVEAGADEGNTECIICMCEPRDTLESVFCPHQFCSSILTMDIVVTDGSNLPERTYVSIRIGETRRQGPYKPDETFHFSNSQHATMKIDLFQYKLKNNAEHVETVDIEGMSVNCKCVYPEDSPASKKRASRHKVTLKATKYLDEHSVQSTLQSMIRGLLEKQPDDALTYMQEFLESTRGIKEFNAKSKGEKTAQVTEVVAPVGPVEPVAAEEAVKVEAAGEDAAAAVFYLESGRTLGRVRLDFNVGAILDKELCVLPATFVAHSGPLLLLASAALLRLNPGQTSVSTSTETSAPPLFTNVTAHEEDLAGTLRELAARLTATPQKSRPQSLVISLTREECSNRNEQRRATRSSGSEDSEDPTADQENDTRRTSGFHLARGRVLLQRVVKGCSASEVSTGEEVVLVAAMSTAQCEAQSDDDESSLVFVRFGTDGSGQITGCCAVAKAGWRLLRHRVFPMRASGFGFEVRCVKTQTTRVAVVEVPGGRGTTAQGPAAALDIFEYQQAGGSSTGLRLGMGSAASPPDAPLVVEVRCADPEGEAEVRVRNYKLEGLQPSAEPCQSTSKKSKTETQQNSLNLFRRGSGHLGEADAVRAVVKDPRLFPLFVQRYAFNSANLTLALRKYLPLATAADWVRTLLRYAKHQTCTTTTTTAPAPATLMMPRLPRVLQLLELLLDAKFLPWCILPEEAAREVAELKELCEKTSKENEHVRQMAPLLGALVNEEVVTTANREDVAARSLVSVGCDLWELEW